jgi:hypothetical protein
MSQPISSQTDDETTKTLFASLAEELKLPLTQIARQAELSELSESGCTNCRAIHTNADTALRLADSYLLSLQLHNGQGGALTREPIAPRSLLFDACHALSPLAGRYGVQLELPPETVSQPVLVQRAVLHSALVSLGSCLITALPVAAGEQQCLQFTAQRNGAGIAMGIYGDLQELKPFAVRRARELHGTARQPLPDLFPGSASGFFIADSILNAMSLHLRASRWRKLFGVSITLESSQQLQLV